MTILSPGIQFIYDPYNSHLLVDAAWYDHHESFQQLEQMLDKCKQLLVLLSRIFYHSERARRTGGLHVVFHFRPSSLCHRNLRLQIPQKYLSHEELEDLVWIKKLNQSAQGRSMMVRTMVRIQCLATKQRSSIVTKNTKRTLKLRSWRSGHDDKYLTAFYLVDKFNSLANIKLFKVKIVANSTQNKLYERFLYPNRVRHVIRHFEIGSQLHFPSLSYTDLPVTVRDDYPPHGTRWQCTAKTFIMAC